MAEIAGWGNFYVIVGGAAGALIGLQFVVITLIAERPIVTGQEMAGSAFATPTIVHLGAVLLLSAFLSVPWHGVTVIAIFWGLLGLAGILYEIIVVRRVMPAQVLDKGMLRVLPQRDGTDGAFAARLRRIGA